MTSPASHAILYTESMVHQVILSNNSATANCYPCRNISPECIYCNTAFQCNGCTAGFVRDFSTCNFKIIFRQLCLHIMRCSDAQLHKLQRWTNLLFMRIWICARFEYCLSIVLDYSRAELPELRQYALPFLPFWIYFRYHPK